MHNLSQALILRNAVLYMDDVITHREIAEVGNKCCGLRFLRLKSRRHIGVVIQIVRAEENEVCIHKAHARGNGRTHNDRHAQIIGNVAGFFQHRLTARMHHAATQPIRNLILTQHRGHTLHITLVRCGDDNACGHFHQLAELIDKRRNGAMKAQRGPCVQLNLAECAVLIENVHCAKLVKVEAEVRLQQSLQNFRAHINVFRPDEIADSAALMPLLHFFPPAINLVAHHAGLIHKEGALRSELEHVILGASHRRKELPPGKNAYTARRRGFNGELFARLVFTVYGHALLAQPRMHTGEQAFRHRRFSQRKEQSFIQARLRALRLGIELADGLNLIAEEL